MALLTINHAIKYKYPLPKLLQTKLKLLVLLIVFQYHDGSCLGREYLQGAGLGLQLDLVRRELIAVIPDGIEGLSFIVGATFVVAVADGKIGIVLLTGGELVIKSSDHLEVICQHMLTV